MREFLAWLLLLLFALMLVIMGIQGSSGRVLAVIFTPASLEVMEGS